MNDWIPCNERLPITSGVYLVTLKWTDKDLWTVTAEYDSDKKEWKGVWGCVKATAWMPRPEPYNGEPNKKK